MTKISNEGLVKITPEDLIGPLNDIEKRFAPEYLYFMGDSKIIQSGPRVSIIGTRKPTEKGIQNTIFLTKYLVENDVIIVSGLARGVDAIAHSTAIKNGGRTIAVLGTPLDKYYPAENRQLQDEIAKNHLAISQFPLGQPVQPKNFPIRNRTMALISHASIIVEAGEKSGTIHQGWEALRLGRPLFIVEDIIKDKNLTWPSKLIEYGAEVLPIEKIKHILEVLPVQIEGLEKYDTF